MATKLLDYESPAVKAQKILSELINQGKDLFIGTPCGILSPLFSEIEKKKGIIYAPREDNAIAIACGAFLSGSKPVVLMQNSGFAQSLNVLASLIEPFKIPITLIISLRGYSIDNTRENRVMGRITLDLLEDLGIGSKILTQDNYIQEIHWSEDYIQQNDKAVALLITPEFFEWRPNE